MAGLSVNSRPSWPAPAVAPRLLKYLQGAFGYKSYLLPAPHLTGRYLWTLTRPDWQRDYPPMDVPVQHRYRATGGQGRIETHRSPYAVIPGVYLYDLRVAYADACQHLPAGPPRHEQGDHYGRYLMGRYRIHFTVPAGWDHVGIFMVPDTALRWRYPAQPGDEAETWASNGEIALARRWGWPVEIRESITFSDTDAMPRPLDVWIGRLQKIWYRAEPDVQAAVRDIILQTIGAFHSARRWTEQTIADDQPIPDGATNVQWHPASSTYTYRVAALPNAADLPYQHPEWAMEIWARTRCKLLDYRGMGALHVPRNHVLGIRTDALYLTHRQPWADSGAVGSFRLKGSHPAPAPAPDGAPALRALVTEEA